MREVRSREMLKRAESYGAEDVKTCVKSSRGRCQNASEGKRRGGRKGGGRRACERGGAGRGKRAERAEKGRKRGLKGLRSAKIKIFGILLTDFARKCIIILL